MDTSRSDNTRSNPDEQPEDDMQDHAKTAEAAFNHPKALGAPIALIERLLAQDADPQEGIQQLCARALANPDALIEAAGNYLTHLLTGGQLRVCPDIPPAFLVEELTHGAVIVSPLLVVHWEEAGDSARLVRLADGLIDQAARLNGSDVGGFVLDVAVRLALQKPVRSLRLIEIARALVEDAENDPLVSEAMRWQAAGDFLRDDGRMFRSFWQKQLRDEAATDWESGEARDAAGHLRRARAAGKEIPSLFLDAMPSAIESPAADDAPGIDGEGAEQPPAPRLAEENFTAPAESAARTSRSRHRAKAGFFPGFLIGSLTMLAAAAWVWKNSAPPAANPPATTAQPQVSRPALDVATPKVVAVPPPPPPATPVVRVEKTETPPAPPLAATAPFVAMIPPRDESPPPAQKPRAAARPERPEDAWRKSEFAALARQHPDLVRWHGVARTTEWSKVRSLVMGLESYLQYTSEEYPHFIALLLLDPPDDAEVAEAVPKIAARRMKPMEVISLWEKLVYPGSPNEKEIRAAADGFLSVKKDVLVPAVVGRLQKLAGPSVK